MAEASDTKGILHQNLIDAGCNQKLTEEIMNLLDRGHIREGIVLLSKYRKTVLDCYHAEQKKIDYLDYLIYQLKKINNHSEKKGQDYDGKSEIRNEMG